MLFTITLLLRHTSEQQDQEGLDGIDGCLGGGVLLLDKAI